MQQFFYEFTKLSFDNLNRQIRLADNKAKFLLSLNLAVISGLSAIMYNNFDKFKTVDFNSLAGAGLSLVLLSMLFLFISFCFTILIIIPKLSPRNNPSKLLYWGQIAKQDISHIQDRYWNTTEEEKMQELITQIYFYSQTATEKYQRVKFSIYALFVALLIMIPSLMLTLFKIH